MIITKDAITELTNEDRELIWEALGVYYQHCANNVVFGHCAKDIFERRMEMMVDAMEAAYVAWGLSYH